MENVFVNVVLSLLGIVNAWLLFMVQSQRADLKELRLADTSLGEKVAAINVLVAGQYVTRTEFHEGMRAQTATLLSGMERILTHRPPVVK